MGHSVIVNPLVIFRCQALALGRVILAMVCAAAFGGCSGLQPPFPRALSVSEYSYAPSPQALAGTVVTPLALWAAPGGAYLDVAVESETWEMADSVAARLAAMAFYGNLAQEVVLEREDKAVIKSDAVIYQSLDPITRVQVSPPSIVRDTGSPHPLSFVTLVFRCNLGGGEIVAVSRRGGAREGSYELKASSLRVKSAEWR